MDPYLRVTDLRVDFTSTDGMVRAVDGVSFTVERGRTLCVVGESGAGKSSLALALLGLHDPRRATVAGEITVAGHGLVGRPEAALRRLRGRDVAMIFQDPLSALHPYHPVGRQIAEAYRVHHRRAGRAETRRRVVEMLDRVGISQPDRRYDQYPHELSGGLRQRAMIAMALVNDPALLIADEPTAALDVTVQAQILELLTDVQAEYGTAIVLITHDLGVVGQVADDVLVMYAGRVMERGHAGQVLRTPQHPYTWGLLASVPSLRGDPEADLRPIPGLPPNLLDLPDGCVFHPRCRHTEPVGHRCRTEPPQLRAVGTGGHRLACHLPTRERIRRQAEETTRVGVAR
ncbi:peptide/nickel transport system ATP-binding protein [Micromonospora sediminimaris]|uniref:Dipeptide/oligopeptide/nickel ABC transporter ATP-binding protein n=2 Tax=Micromonosporaceae TaxID=28056 RepID=A0A9W5XM41_9ACTN|nr:dipeptide/oligopeptide/nickel ABC transporter ATP-binding protein [Micromonospora sediminimaris]SFC96525.1 peptide/nickel transport system ATP-binding protein [Micromonospora sediminimaris]